MKVPETDRQVSNAQLPGRRNMTLRLLQVLEAFQVTAGAHLTASDIYRILLIRGNPVSLSCTYRLINRLHKAGLLGCTPGKPGFGGGKHLFWRTSHIHDGPADPARGQQDFCAGELRLTQSVQRCVRPLAIAGGRAVTRQRPRRRSSTGPCGAPSTAGWSGRFSRPAPVRRRLTPGRRPRRSSAAVRCH